MLAREVFENAMVLAGMVNPDGTVDREREADLMKQGTVFLNRIYSDLFYSENPGGAFNPASMNDDLSLTLSERALHDIMPWGIAMLLAGSVGDSVTQSIMAATYSQKREGTVKRTRTITDALPTGDW